MDKDTSKKLDKALKALEGKKVLQTPHFLVTKAVADAIKKGSLHKHPGDHDQEVHDPTQGRGGARRKDRLQLDPETGATVLTPKPSLTMSSPESAEKVRQELKAGLKKPYVKAYVSTLGGKERPAVMLTVSLDPKESWTNGILENSRYGKFDIDHTGRVEQISGSLKFRSTKVKSVEHLVSLLNTKLTGEGKKITKRGNVIPSVRLGRTTKVQKHPGNHDQSVHSPTRRNGPTEGQVDTSVRAIRQASKDYKAGNISLDELKRIRAKASSHNIGKRVAHKRGSVKPKGNKIRKHPGHADQGVHSPTGKPASRAPAKVRMRVAGHRLRQAGEAVAPKATKEAQRKLRQKLNPRVLIPQIDSVLDDIDAGTRIYRRLKEIRDEFQDMFRPQSKVTKSLVSVQAALEKHISKGISHSLDTLTSAAKLIRAQKPNEKISGESDRKLGELIDGLKGMIGYLKDVKKQGFFEKKGEVFEDRIYNPTRGIERNTKEGSK